MSEDVFNQMNCELTTRMREMIEKEPKNKKASELSVKW